MTMINDNPEIVALPLSLDYMDVLSQHLGCIVYDHNKSTNPRYHTALIFQK